MAILSVRLIVRLSVRPSVSGKVISAIYLMIFKSRGQRSRLDFMFEWVLFDLFAFFLNASQLFSKYDPHIKYRIVHIIFILKGISCSFPHTFLSQVIYKNYHVSITYEK